MADSQLTKVTASPSPQLPDLADIVREGLKVAQECTKALLSRGER